MVELLLVLTRVSENKILSLQVCPLNHQAERSGSLKNPWTPKSRCYGASVQTEARDLVVVTSFFQITWTPAGGHVNQDNQDQMPAAKLTCWRSSRVEGFEG